MAQVYQFVDDNGITRLFAEIHPDPAGTPFNGGTITQPLVIDVGALATAGGVEITGTSGANVKRLGVDFLHTALSVTGDGVYSLSGDDGVQLNVSESAGNDAEVNAISTTQTSRMTASNGFSTTGGQLRIFDAGGVVMQAVLSQTAFIFRYHAAPADGDLTAGDCALWFDQTNGAAALNIKAKQANGTVKTATIPVIT